MVSKDRIYELASKMLGLEKPPSPEEQADIPQPQTIEEYIDQNPATMDRLKREHGKYFQPLIELQKQILPGIEAIRDLVAPASKVFYLRRCGGFNFERYPDLSNREIVTAFLAEDRHLKDTWTDAVIMRELPKVTLVAVHLLAVWREKTIGNNGKSEYYFNYEAMVAVHRDNVLCLDDDGLLSGLRRLEVDLEDITNDSKFYWLPSGHKKPLVVPTPGRSIGGNKFPYRDEVSRVVSFGNKPRMNVENTHLLEEKLARVLQSPLLVYTDPKADRHMREIDVL